MNVDPNEIHQFNALSAEWWNPNGPMKPLHQLNPVRLAFVEQHCTLAGKNVLDVGCGAGLLSEAMAQKKGIVTGVDLAEDVLAVAKDHAKSNRIMVDYALQSAESMASEKPNAFDVVTCMEMLEHVPDPSKIIQACYDSLVPGGMAFFSTITRTPKAYALTILAAEYILGLLPKGTHQYDKFIKPSELISSAREIGFSRKALVGLNYQPLRSTFHLSNNIHANYVLALRK